MWNFLVTNRNGVEIAELIDASVRKVTRPLNKIINGSFTVQPSHPLVNVFRQTDQTMIKAYRDGVLMGFGPIYKTNKVRGAQQNSLAVNWAGVGWRLGKRIIESSKLPSGVTYGTPSVYLSKGTMASTIITELNTAPLVVTLAGNQIQVVNVANPAPGGQVNPLPQSDTGVRVGSVDPLIPNSYVGPWYYKNALQAIMELSATLDGFDWQILPTEPTSDSIGLQLGTFNAAVAIGATRLDSVFEFGDGRRNVASFTEDIDVSGVIQRAYSLPQSFPDNATGAPFMQYDYPAMQARGVVYEDMVSSDLVTDDARNRLLQANMRVRSTPKTVITFVPTNDPTTGVCPNYGTDYQEGDLVPFRAMEYGQETVNGLFRIYQVDFDIADNGDETATPTLVSNLDQTS